MALSVGVQRQEGTRLSAGLCVLVRVPYMIGSLISHVHTLFMSTTAGNQDFSLFVFGSRTPNEDF